MTVITLFGSGLFALLLCLFLYFFKGRIPAQSVMLEEVTRQARGEGRGDIPQRPDSSVLVRRLAKPFTYFRGLVFPQPDAEIARRLSLAGYREPIHADPDLSQEFLQINFEQRAGVPRLDCWKAFADRLDLEELREFVAMLTQTERFGTPIAAALLAFSETLRGERRQKAEELGAKAAIKLLFPLVFFIFPMVFIVTVGPSFIGLLQNLEKLLE